ncbi:MAG: hypothetical protein ACREDR_47405, partial [Blastocatellia bacterium]
CEMRAKSLARGPITSVDAVLTSLELPDWHRPSRSSRALASTPTMSGVHPARNEAEPKQILPLVPDLDLKCKGLEVEILLTIPTPNAGLVMVDAPHR